MLTTLLPLARISTSGNGLLEAFSRSGPMAAFVLGSLAFLSVVSWAVLIWKWLHLRRARSHTRHFLEIFRGSKRFSEVSAHTARVATSPLVGIFQAGYAEIDGQIRSLGEEPPAEKGKFRIRSLAGVERSLRRAVAAETQLLVRGASFLATTAASAPFIGLFGTVWGIMRAFEDIGRTGSTSLVAVAPGIAEALVNTAAGLAAAIPALIGYNYLGGRFKRMRAVMEDFALEFLNLAERNFT
ncbi:MAG TPA: MotA/TolQ/ExbB proton channel family protein [Thermoanaerobaculia bacterium]|nr:MotA/TolQ/ExbB proton channel family protein [Thermoanaerobaculia bacterium]